MLFPCPAFVNATRFPEKPAIFWGGRSISWVAVNNYVHSTSRYIKEISVKKGDRVIVVTDRSPAYYIVILALWRIGVIVCPVLPDASEDEVRMVHDVVKPDFVISHRSVRKAWSQGVRSADIEQVVAYGYNDAFLGSEAALDPKLGSEDVALLRLVSSSTGIELKAVTHDELRSDPQELAGFFSALLTGDKFIIS
jgi:acyl-CoA synthetase (AMP-forming)/AMP-acid ligase II